MRAELPTDESERISALLRYNILDTEPEISYDRITRTARQIFDVPVCLITLVDSARQFFKSKVGVDVKETPRDLSFCAHGLLQDETLVVPDATEDARFADNPLVTESPYIRFYAGAQLKTKDGFKLGSLCVIDTISRMHPTLEQICILEDLAAQVVELLEAGRGQQDIESLRTDLEGVQQTLLTDRKRWRRMEQTAELALAAGRMGYWEWDELAGRCQWSERMYTMTGLPVGSNAPSLQEWIELVHPEDRPSFAEKLLNIRRPSGETFTLKFRIQGLDKPERWLTMVGDHYFSVDGNLIGSFGVAWDSTDTDRKERALEESEELFRVLSASCPVGIARTDLNGSAVYVNPKVSEMWGMPPEDLTGLRWTSRVHPEDLKGFLEA